MLLNLVTLRYGDASVFLDIASVITQYQIFGSLSLTSSCYINPTTFPTLALGAEGIYSNCPTVTFSPLGGEAGPVQIG